MEQTKAYVQSNDLQYPTVLAHEEGQGLKLVMDSGELAGFKGDPQAFMQRAKEKLAEDSNRAV